MDKDKKRKFDEVEETATEEITLPTDTIIPPEQSSTSTSLNPVTNKDNRDVEAVTTSSQSLTTTTSFLQKIQKDLKTPVIFKVKTVDDFFLDIDNNKTLELQEGLELLRERQLEEAEISFSSIVSNRYTKEIKIQARFFLLKIQAEQMHYKETLSDLEILHQDCIENGFQQAAQVIVNDYENIANKWKNQLLEEPNYTQPKTIVTMLDSWLALHDMHKGKQYSEASRVEQHEYGVSNKGELGTDNIHECLAIIIRAPTEHKSLLAHFDYATEPTSLADAIKKHFSNSQSLDISLVGGKLSNRTVLNSIFDDATTFEEAMKRLDDQQYALSQKMQSQSAQDSSIANLKSILEVLVEYETKITAIRVGDVGLSNSEHSNAIIANPLTGNINLGQPVGNSEERWLRDGWLYIGGAELPSPLREAFFNGNEPVYLNQDIIEGFLLHANNKQCLDLIRDKDNPLSNEQLQLKIAEAQCTLNYPIEITAKSIKGISTVLANYHETVQQMQAQFNLSAHQIDDYFKQKGVYLGIYSKEKNIAILKDAGLKDLAGSTVTTTSSMSSSSAIIANQPELVKPAFVKGKAVPEHSVFQAKANIQQEVSTTQSATTTSSDTSTSTLGLGTGQSNR